jgi:hypothetical protein
MTIETKSLLRVFVPTVSELDVAITLYNAEHVCDSVALRIAVQCTQERLVVFDVLRNMDSTANASNRRVAANDLDPAR